MFCLQCLGMFDRVFILSLFFFLQKSVQGHTRSGVPLASSECCVETAYHCLSFQHKKPGSSEVLLRHPTTESLSSIQEGSVTLVRGRSHIVRIKTSGLGARKEPILLLKSESKEHITSVHVGQETHRSQPEVTAKDRVSALVFVEMSGCEDHRSDPQHHLRTAIQALRRQRQGFPWIDLACQTKICRHQVQQRLHFSKSRKVPIGNLWPPSFLTHTRIQCTYTCEHPFISHACKYTQKKVLCCLRIMIFHSRLRNENKLINVSLCTYQQACFGDILGYCYCVVAFLCSKTF